MTPDFRNPYLQQFSISYFPLKEDDEGEEGDEDDDDDGSEMELDEDYPDMNASPLVRFERFDREDDLIIEFDNMFSSASKIQGLSWVLSLDSYTLNQKALLFLADFLGQGISDSISLNKYMPRRRNYERLLLFSPPQ